MLLVRNSSMHVLPLSKSHRSKLLYRFPAPILVVELCFAAQQLCSDHILVWDRACIAHGYSV